MIGLLIASIALFFAAAKAHGRQLRLEREFEGHYSVEFGGKNHPWVEALWRAERFRFWILVAAFEIPALVLSFMTSFNWKILLLLIGWIPSFAFSITGALSLLRLTKAIIARTKSSTAHINLRPDWAVSAIITSALWWLLVLVLVAAISALLALQR